MSHTAIYELAVLYRSDSEDALDKLSAKIKKLITDADGQILKEDVWGKRQLAYPIKKQTHALYIFYDLEIEGKQLDKIESILNITEEVLRYQFHKPDLKTLAIALARPAREGRLEKKDNSAKTPAKTPMEVSDVTQS